MTDSIRRGAMWALSSVVGGIAATVSYTHIYSLARSHGGTVLDSRLLPLSVDALILVGEVMLLHQADKKGQRFILGWVLVASGILATLTANVTFGAQFGIAGALLWGWPAYSFILVAAGMVAIVKRSSNAEPQPDSGGLQDFAPADALKAAEASLRATLAAGNPWSQRALSERFNITRADAKGLHALVLGASNGHVPDEDAA